MKKVEFINKIAEEVGITKTEAEKALNVVFGTIKEEVKAGNKIQIAAFGTFEPRNRAAREGRNPQTGETMQIPASVTAGFKLSKTFKDELNA